MPPKPAFGRTCKPSRCGRVEVPIAKHYALDDVREAYRELGDPPHQRQDRASPVERNLVLMTASRPSLCLGRGRAGIFHPAGHAEGMARQSVRAACGLSMPKGSEMIQPLLNPYFGWSWRFRLWQPLWWWRIGQPGGAPCSSACPPSATDRAQDLAAAARHGSCGPGSVSVRTLKV